MRNYLEPQLHLLEGMRPCDQIQALVSTAVLRNTTTQYDWLQCQRLNMILAVLEKELVLGLARCFPNIGNFSR
jgi:predicted ATP-dependent serine protease